MCRDSDLTSSSAKGMNVWTPVATRLSRRKEYAMRFETKYLRLQTPVTLGSRFGDWQVCWLGGWTRHRLSYVVMVVRKVTVSE